MYVYAKYVEDYKTIIVPVSNVKRFDPNKKYAVDKTFKVKYIDGLFYRAYILAVGETPEETEQLANKKRFRKPTHHYDIFESAVESTEESETDQVVFSNEVENHIKKNSVNDTGKQNFRTILKQGLNAEEVQVNVKLLKGDLLKANNKILQMEKQIEELTQLNYKLQHEVIDKFKDLQPSPVTYPNQESSLDKKFQVGERHEGNVHLGREVWLPAKVFDAIYRKKKDTIFVKELAMAIFGEELLLNSSTLGHAGNRTRKVARPSLPPTELLAIQDILRFRLLERGESLEAVNKSVALMDKIINEKIQDLRRLPRNTMQENRNFERNSLEEPLIETPLQQVSISIPTELELVNDSTLLEIAANAEIMLVGEENAPSCSAEQ